MKTRIVIDSTTNIDETLRRELTVVPLTLHFGEEEYLDGVTIDCRQFYEKLIESDVVPTTSQPAPEAFAEIYARAAAAGEEVLVLTISSELSGTYQSAVIAAEGCLHVRVVDSRSVAIGAGLLAELAAGMARAGMGADAIAQALVREREKVCLVAMLNTLEYLKRGGRISKTAAFAGEMLSIKPVIGIRDGRVVILGKARGSKRGNNMLVEEIEKAGGVDFDKPILLGYTGLHDGLLRKYVKDSAFLWQDHVAQLKSCPIGSVIGTHAGPDAVAVAFFSAR